MMLAECILAKRVASLSTSRIGPTIRQAILHYEYEAIASIFVSHKSCYNFCDMLRGSNDNTDLLQDWYGFASLLECRHLDMVSEFRVAIHYAKHTLVNVGVRMERRLMCEM